MKRYPVYAWVILALSVTGILVIAGVHVADCYQRHKVGAK